MISIEIAGTRMPIDPANYVITRIRGLPEEPILEGSSVVPPLGPFVLYQYFTAGVLR